MFALAAIWVWVTQILNNHEVLKEAEVPLKCELLPTWTYTGDWQALLFLPWILLFLIFAMALLQYCLKRNELSSNESLVES